MTGLYVASNPTALGAQFSLTNNMDALATTLTRLSTGLKINSGKDDPAGLIASELLKAEITGTNQAITNTQRANSMISTADSALGQVSNLLNDIKGLVVEAANTGAMSADQIKANQLQVDASLQAIDRIAQSTTYAGNKLLDGSMDFSTDLCGTTNANGISNLMIDAANFGTASKIDVNVNVMEAARKGTLIYNGSGVDEKTTLDITGSTGTKSFTFGAGTSTADMAAAIAASSDSTGVTAYVEGAPSRGSVTLNGTGSNNGIVITANENGVANGNYSFKIVAGDQDGVRIASEPTNNSPGVVEIMLKQSFQKSYQNIGGILDIGINGESLTDTSGVTIKKGTTNQAVYHQGDANATATTADGQKTVTINGTDDKANNATSVSYTDMSKLNGWTFKVVADGTTVGGQAIDDANGIDALYDDEAKIVYINSAATDDGLEAALQRITGDSALAAADALSITGTLVLGDSFKLGGGGAEGELELTYKEGATVNDILKLANNAGGNVTASLANGVDGSALIKDVLSGNSRAFGDTMTASRTTSTATANDVIAMINSQLGDKFTATLLTGDTGTGLMTYMDAAVDSGSVNMDNAIRFTGMDNGPIVRMVTTDANGTAIKNQKLSVSLINPSEADIANGIFTPVLQINLATDGAGNSITTAADIVELFNNLTPEQTGGISASLILPDGVDVNGRTWYTDECGNIKEVTDCNAKYGTGIVQPTGVPGPCEIQQNDLVLLGTNQSLVDSYAVARIGSISDLNAAAVTPSEAIAYGDANNNIETVSNHSGLAGVSIKFTTDDNQAGFNEADGTLMVYLSPETQAATTAGGDDIGALMTDAVNGAIAQNWQGIRQFTGATGNATTVTVTTNSASGAAAVTAWNAFNANGGVKFADNTTMYNANNIRGLNATDPALTIKALDKGTSMAGVKVVLQHDESMAATTANGGITTINELAVEYDEKNGILTIKTNGADGISAQALATALNDNDVFKKYFSADATTILDDAAPTGLDADYGNVYFGSATTSAATFSGGYKIVTEEKATGGANVNVWETSAGIGMTGASDDNQRLVLQAVDAGSENFVKVSVAEGSFRTFCPLGYEMCELAGTDVVATINGLAAVGRGNNISINTADLAMSMDVDGNVGTTSFSITGGGALFQLGSNVVSSQQMRIGIGSMMTTKIGGSSGKLFQLKTGGSADLITSDASRKLADKIVNEAISYVTNTRGRLGAIQKSSLDPNISVLQDSLVALTEAEASYSNADFAEESSNLTRLQLLIQSGMSTLGIANQLPQYAASLIG